MAPSDPEGSFRTHAHYLSAFSRLAGHTPVPAVMTKALTIQRAKVLASSSLHDTARGNPDHAGLRRSLANTWGTELLIALGRQYAVEDELVRITNNWAAVQAYYVSYHAFQAYLLANGEARPTTHLKTQTMFANRWASRTLDMPPWTFAAADGAFLNGPSARTVDLTIHPWATCNSTSCWDIAGHALKSTREEAVERTTHRHRERKQAAAKKAWESKEATRITAGRRARKVPTFPLPRLDAAEKRSSGRSVRPYTAMDYLYRLRIKTNYEDSMMFTDGPTSEPESRAAGLDLQRLAASVLLMHELHVRERIGIPAMTTLVDGWVSANIAHSPGLGVSLRRDLILQP